MKLSRTKIESYVGNTMPLRLLADENIENAPIKWEVEGEAVTIRTFESDEEHPFCDGVILRFVRVGEATVSATLGEERFECRISAREMKHSDSDADFNYYRGDFHTHTTGIHKHDAFINRTEEFQTDMISFIKEENKLDVGVMTDHADVSSMYEYFRCHALAEDAEPMKTVLFPGCESDNIIPVVDRLGKNIRMAGEVVCINGDTNKTAYGWEDLLDAFKESPRPIGIFAHPNQDAWYFDFRNIIKIDGVRDFMRGIEIGQGKDFVNCLVHEYAFSDALDAGFRVSTTSSSDGHRTWGFDAYPGKTVVMATERTKEAFTDALISNRFYGSETGNVKLRLSVNGKYAPCDLPLTDTYKFKLSLSYFEKDEDSRIVRCQVISDGGMDLVDIKDIEGDTVEFEVKSNTARYFFLRLSDKLARRTFTPPVWCSRPFDEYIEPSLEIIDSRDFTAYDEISGKDAAATVRFNPGEPWCTDEKTASVIIDMMGEKEISALGFYPPTAPLKSREDPRIKAKFHKMNPSKYRISTSDDGKEYTVRAIGRLRRIAIEDIIPLGEHTARFIKFEVLSTIGYEYGRAEYVNSNLHLGGLTVYKKV